jgi:hypothetical protein
MMPRANTVALDNPPPTEEVVQAEQPAALGGERVAERDDVHPRNGDVRADPVDQNADEGEGDLLPQLWRSVDVLARPPLDLPVP